MKYVTVGMDLDLDVHPDLNIDSWERFLYLLRANKDRALTFQYHNRSLALLCGSCHY